MNEIERTRKENQLLKKTLAELGKQNAELEERVRSLTQTSLTDEETNLYSETVFWKRLDEEISRAQRHRQFLSLLLIDAEDYSEGLPYLASSLRKALRKIDIVSRLKKDQIGIALLETAESDVESVIRRIRDSLKDSEKVRIGVASYPSDADGHRALLEVARNRIRNTA